MNNKLIIDLFCYNDIKITYFITDNKEIWFKGKDICDVIEYSNHNKALMDHVNINDKLKISNNSNSINNSLPLGGNDQTKMIFINLSGLKSLINKSKNSNSKHFKECLYKMLPFMIDAHFILSLKAYDLYTSDNVIYIAYIGTRNNENIYEFGKTNNLCNFVAEKCYRYKIFKLIHTIKPISRTVLPLFKRYLKEHNNYKCLNDVIGFITNNIHDMIDILNLCNSLELFDIGVTNKTYDSNTNIIVNNCFYDNQFIDMLNKSTNFDEFCDKLSILSNDLKGYYFELFAQLFFKFDNRYSNYVENCWLLNELPEKIREELSIPRKDIGIDIIIKTFNDGYWAVQAKYRNMINTSLNWSSISTFCGLSFGLSKKFNKGIIFTNTKYANKYTIGQENITNILYYSLKNISESTFDKIKAYVNNKTMPSKPNLNPRPYQQEIINKATEYYKNMSCGRLYMACGTGKTFVSYCIAMNQQYKGKICIVAPSLQLVSQIYKTWSDQSHKCKYLLIGSSAEVKSNPHCGLLLSITFDEIYKYLDKYKEDNIVIISTYQSSDILASVCKKYNIIIDFCIFDEAHRTVGSKERSYSCLLDDNNTQIRKRLFITATEKIYIGNNESILSMDNEKIYGKIIYNYSLKRAIGEGYLTDYQIISPIITDESFWKIINENSYILDKNIKNDVIKSRYYMTAYILAISIRDKNINHILTFNNTNENAIKFNHILKKILEILEIDCECYILSGKSSMSHREYVLDDFKRDKRAIISSSRIFSEGVDIPIVDCVCLVDNKISINDIIQTCGRPLRKYPNKKMSYIIIPAVINMNYELNDITHDNIYDTNNIDSFKLMKTVLRSMATVDDRIIDHFSIKETANKYYYDKFTVNVDNIIPHCDIKFDVNLLKEKVNTIICDKWGDLRWFSNCNLLFEYCELYNEIPQNDVVYKNKYIGLWFNTNKFKIKSIDDELYKKLTANILVKNNIDEFLIKRKTINLPLVVDTKKMEYNDLSLEDQINDVESISEVKFKNSADELLRKRQTINLPLIVDTKKMEYNDLSLEDQINDVESIVEVKFKNKNKRKFLYVK